MMIVSAEDIEFLDSMRAETRKEGRPMVRRRFAKESENA